MTKRPTVVGLTLCEKVIVEEGTRNPTLVNCFRRRAEQQFPSPPSLFYAVAALTDGLGEMDLEMVVQHLDDLEEIYQNRGALPSRTPWGNYLSSFGSTGVPSLHPGGIRPASGSHGNG